MSTEFGMAGADRDRRESDRAIALYRPAIIESDGLQTFCLVRNLSSGGLMASVQARFVREQEVFLRFSEATMIQGTVVWTQEDRIGVKFTKPIDISALLTELAEGPSGANSYRSPRLKVSCEGAFFVHSERRKVELLDISQRGFKAKVASSAVEEQGVALIPGMEPRKAVVRWVDGATAGFYFIDPIGFSELGSWIMNLSGGPQHREES